DLLQEIVIAKDNGFSFNNNEDIEPEIENNIIDKITNRLEFSYSEEINNEDNEINYEIDKNKIDEANNDNIEIDEINNEDAIDEIALLVFEFLDVESANSEDLPNFPSEEFSDFMKLVIKWNLSDLCINEIFHFSKKIAHNNIILPTSIQQGKQCLDKIMVQHISFKKVLIVEYEDKIYYLNYRSIFDAIKELLSNEDILNYCVFEFTLLYYQGQWIYYEQFNEK
ncbi:21921_t:CDS:2, partial [Cetraspora pellucida]